MIINIKRLDFPIASQIFPDCIRTTKPSSMLENFTYKVIKRNLI